MGLSPSSKYILPFLPLWILNRTQHVLLLLYTKKIYLIDKLRKTTKGTRICFLCKKSRIRETKLLSTDADSSTDAIGGWTNNTQKPNFFDKRKKSPKTQKLRNV